MRNNQQRVSGIAADWDGGRPPPLPPFRQSRGEVSSGGLDRKTRWAVSPVVLCLMDTLLIIKYAMPNDILISQYYMSRGLDD